MVQLLKLIKSVFYAGDAANGNVILVDVVF